jgi:hypothetical protein
MVVLDTHEGFIVNVKGKERLLAKMRDSEEKGQGLRLFDTIRACIYIDNEDKFLSIVKKFTKIE